MSRCSFDATCFTVHDDLGRGCFQFGAQNVSYGMSSDARVFESIRRVTLESMEAWISVDFGWLWETRFGSDSSSLGQHVFSSCSLPGYVFS